MPPTAHTSYVTGAILPFRHPGESQKIKYHYFETETFYYIYGKFAMQEFFDNINNRVIDDLKVSISEGSRLSIAAATFSIYAFQELKQQLLNIEELRFIFTEPSFLKEKEKRERRQFYIPRIDRERTLYGSPFEVKLRNRLTQKAIATECAEWIKEKVTFKSNVTDDKMNGYINVSGKEECAYLPINGFTTTDLGCEKGNNILNFVTKLDVSNSKALLKSFDEIWNDSKRFSDVTEQVAENISNIYKENAPEFVYFITLYNIFHEFLEDISNDVLPDEATGFKSSQIWNKLYDFQKDAALAIINKLEKYNGCILADSVGLGKTFTALSVIKYYEGRNKSVLVLCPKKLNDNWITYKSNYINNPIAKDRLRYDILFHSDLSRNKGYTNGLDLSHINWSNYDLVVIDESHNFRNGGKIYGDEDNKKENRYLQLMNKVIKAGVKTKVLMLSATPVNNRFNDLKNQLQLAYEGEVENMDRILNTESSIEDIFRQAQKAYNVWSKLPQEERITERLLGMLSFDFFEVLDSVTIARSRKHIEAYYDTAAIGRFPTRLTPISRRPSLTDLPCAINYNEIFGQLQKLNLSIYTPSVFILPSKAHKYNHSKGDGAKSGLSLEGREMGIRRLMSINMLKRLESSVNSFRLTLERVQNLIQDTIERIDNHESEIDVQEANIYDLDIEDQENEAFIGTRKNRIALEDLDYISWRKYLKNDFDELELTRLMLLDITPEHDSKLQQLISDLRGKFEHPINKDNRKVIIFTAFSDTALYLYNNLAGRIKDRYGLNVAIVTGDIDARSTLKTNEKMDFNKVLTLFSPMSKEKAVIYPEINEGIDVLIATDCISEGQNLQDCDYLINYDIHWNPVRIIQRFGRIDRIGSQNEVIQLVNYWPDMTLDEYIDLKGRVEARMKVSVMTSTGDDNPISPEEKGDLEYRKAQLKKLQEEVVDIEDMSDGVSIMDLGLNEFRLDLLEYMHTHKNVELTPFGLHAVVSSNKYAEPGVIFVLKNRNNGVNIDKKNRLHPFYMVYLRYDGSVVVNYLSPKDLLDRFRSLCKGKSKPETEPCKEFNKETRNGFKMERYSKLLGDAVSSIINVKEESDIDSFLSGIQSELFTKEITGIDNFELICFLVVR